MRKQTLLLCWSKAIIWASLEVHFRFCTPQPLVLGRLQAPDNSVFWKALQLRPLEIFNVKQEYPAQGGSPALTELWHPAHGALGTTGQASAPPGVRLLLQFRTAQFALWGCKGKALMSQPIPWSDRHSQYGCFLCVCAFGIWNVYFIRFSRRMIFAKTRWKGMHGMQSPNYTVIV